MGLLPVERCPDRFTALGFLVENIIGMILAQSDIPYIHGDQTAEDSYMFGCLITPATVHVHPGRVELAVWWFVATCSIRYTTGA